MKKLVLLLVLVCLICGCAPAGNPVSGTVAPETTAAPATAATTQPAVPVYVEETVALEAVNKHAFYKTSESPAAVVMDARTVAFVTTEYINKDFSRKYTRVRLVDPHTGSQRTEVVLDGTYSVLPHSALDGLLALVNGNSDEILVLDKGLQAVLSFDARSQEGILTEDLRHYFYIWGSKLYQMDVKTGESSLFIPEQDLLLDEIWGYDPEQNRLLVSIFEDTYTTDLCMGAINLQTGDFGLLYRGISSGSMTGDGIFLEHHHTEERMSDVYFGNWTSEAMQILPGFLVNDLDFASWHITGSDYICKFTYDSQKVNIVDFQLYRLGDTVEVCSLQSQLKGAKITSTHALPDGNILAVAAGGRGYQTWLICPEKLEFAPAALEISQGGSLVDTTILEGYEKEPVFDLPEDLAGVRQMADRLEEKYDITILLSSQCELAASYCTMPITTTNQAGLYNEVASIEEALKHLDEVLQLYPADFFGQFKNEAGERGLLVLLVEDIAAELNVIGVSYTMGQWYPVAVDITSGQVRNTYCHEFWHATENRIEDLDKGALDLEAWEACNPVGFRYSGEAKEGYWEDTQYTYFYGNEEDGFYFVDPYGKTQSQEDRARLMEYMMCTEFDAQQMMKHPALKTKMQLLCDAIREVFDTSAWDDVHWERFF